uniref:Uncharacterized protein n=1 Tax=Glossina austeni TaxID=7395 RepID=A0A1A9V612_GLOAU
MISADFQSNHLRDVCNIRFHSLSSASIPAIIMTVGSDVTIKTEALHEIIVALVGGELLYLGNVLAWWMPLFSSTVTPLLKKTLGERLLIMLTQNGCPNVKDSALRLAKSLWIA